MLEVMIVIKWGGLQADRGKKMHIPRKQLEFVDNTQTRVYRSHLIALPINPLA